MKGAIFFSGMYGSTQQYSNWIGEATGLPVFNIEDSNADLSKYDFLILGSSILYFKLSIRKWAKTNLKVLDGRAKILFSVSGAGPSAKLERWVANSMPTALLSQNGASGPSRQAGSFKSQLVDKKNFMDCIPFQP